MENRVVFKLTKIYHKSPIEIGEEIVSKMQEEYDVDASVLERDVESFTQKLKEAGLLE